MTKLKFIEDEFISSAICGAFQRAKVYADAKSDNDPNRKKLQTRLAALLRDLKAQYKNTVVSDQEHIENIERIADVLTEEFEKCGILNKNRFRIGIAQKVLNLYLKYLWCAGEIKTPPHCPFDYGIIARLPLSDKQKQDLQWTKLDKIEDYQALVDAARTKIATTQHASLSDWELGEWNKSRNLNS